MKRVAHWLVLSLRFFTWQNIVCFLHYDCIKINRVLIFKIGPQMFLEPFIQLFSYSLFDRVYMYYTLFFSKPNEVLALPNNMNVVGQK